MIERLSREEGSTRNPYSTTEKSLPKQAVLTITQQPIVRCIIDTFVSGRPFPGVPGDSTNYFWKSVRIGVAKRILEA